MKTLSLVIAAFAACSASAVEPPRWLTVMPLPRQGEEAVARNIRDLGKNSIVDAVAYSCTFVPEGEPAVDKAALLAPRYRKMHELLKGSGVREGILFQATMGHGWTPNTPTAGTKVIRADGYEMYKFCPLDPKFLDYVAGQAKTIGELRPDFFMVDDDTRLITCIDGCFCPLHLKAISELSGRTFATRQDLQAALKKDAKLAEQWDGLLRDCIAELVKVIRAQIPAEIPGEFCCCARDSHHAGLMAKLLAAPGQRPVIRINNARYLQDRLRDFPVTLARTARQIADLPEGTVVLDEADTCPQNRYSMGAEALVHHMVMNSLEGCSGAKIWITRMGNAKETDSGVAYRELFRRRKGYMKAATSLGLRREGVRIPLPPPSAHKAGVDLGHFDWSTALFGRIGVPWSTGRVRPGDVVALYGCQVPLFSDEELKAMLSGAVLLEGDAAVRLTERGFGRLIGAEARLWKGAAISAERYGTTVFNDGPYAAADLTAKDPKAEVVGTYLHRVSGVSAELEELGPGTIRFVNELGGRVCTFAAFLPLEPQLSGKYSYHNETRKRELLKALRWLGRGKAPGGVTYPGDAELLLEAGTASDGRRIVVLDNIGLDVVDGFVLSCDTAPTLVNRLADDGTWQNVPFARDGETVRLLTKLETFRPAVFEFVSTKVPATVSPYGVCAHVTRSERDAHRLKGTLDAMEMAGMKYVRSDFDAGAMKNRDGSWNFSNYDALIGELEARGVTLLPILYAPENPPKDLEAYKDYVRNVVRHFGRRLPVVEIWNEANLNGFFRGADPVAYANTLKAAYEAVKSVDPSVRVAFTGTAGVPLDWIRKVFESGAAKSFDVMNVHPYSHPAQPEGAMDVNTERLRGLMAEFGVADKPIWFTEIGWPTHTLTVSFTHILLAGLKVARPEQKSWKMIMVDHALEGNVDQALAKELEELLPVGSSVVACTQPDAVKRLAAGGVDAVVYPFDETYPADTADAVNEFIRKGGVLVDFGGLPCYFGRRGTEAVKGLQHGGGLGRFPFGYHAWWTGKKGTYPESAQVFATEHGLAAGVKQEPTGFKAMRFLSPERAGKDAEWIPLVAGKTTNGVELVGAAVIRYHGDRQGAAVLCSLYPARGVSGTNNEENQARFTARGLGLAFAEGVEAYFPYNLRSFEVDPYYSEHHFGLMHADFQPKPAYSAYANFTRMRPAGSVNASGDWHDADRRVFYPQWTRPDGKKAGMVWAVGQSGLRTLRFAGGEPVFCNLYGRKFTARKVADGEYRVKIDDSPVYFCGAELVR